MIIALLNQKGGVGKTTLATHLAGEFAMRGQRAAVIDADPQGSALDWAQTRGQAGRPTLFGVLGLPRETLHQEVPAIARSVDHVIIDGPPRITALARSALLAADLILVPVQPSAYDVWASSEIVALIRDARIFKPNLRAALVVNRRVVRTVIGRDVHAALDQRPVDVLRVQICQRIAFAESVATGQLVREIDDDSLAAREISALASEILERAP